MRTELVLAIPIGGLAITILVLWRLGKARAQQAIIQSRVDRFVIRRD